MRTIAVVTVNRSDYGLYRPLLRQLQAHPDVNLRLLVGTTLYSPDFSTKESQFHADGFEPTTSINLAAAGHSPRAIAEAMVNGLRDYVDTFGHPPPDLLVLLGDRWEMHLAAVAAVPLLIPIAHLHGGELTLGAIDDALRHSLTKLSHLHFVSTAEHGRRVAQMGEEPWRIFPVGALGVDAIREVRQVAPRTDTELNQTIAHQVGSWHHGPLKKRVWVGKGIAPVVVIFHPATLEYTRAAEQTAALTAALATIEGPFIILAPGPDAGREAVYETLGAFGEQRTDVALLTALASPDYLALLARARVLVGNSSSGLLEAPSFELPVVNIGRRQQGRTRAANVIDVPAETDAITAALQQATSAPFRESLRGLVNPYGDGHTAERIVAQLTTIPLDERLLRKQFVDWPAPAVPTRRSAQTE